MVGGNLFVHAAPRYTCLAAAARSLLALDPPPTSAKKSENRMGCPRRIGSQEVAALLPRGVLLQGPCYFAKGRLSPQGACQLLDVPTIANAGVGPLSLASGNTSLGDTGEPHPAHACRMCLEWTPVTDLSLGTS